MRFLIPNMPNDMSTLIVKDALETRGHEVSLSHNQLSVDYDVVWWRAAAYQIMENNAFYDATDLAPNAWWINSKKASDRVAFKVLQLKTASDCGLMIPTTLCSNDPCEIKQFYLKYQESGISQVAQNVSQVASVFQKNVKKKYTIQVTCFGDYLVAAKCISTLRFDPYSLPNDLAFKIRTCMQAFGIVFGTFHFAVTLADEYVFMDVNNQGQFLKIEHCNPDFKMLDMFVNFMVNKTVDFPI